MSLWALISVSDDWILCVKIKSLAWKKSFLCAWKFTPNTWKLKKKSTWKTLPVRENFEKSVRETQLPYVKKMKKSPKNRFTHTFYFHVVKKNTAPPLHPQIFPLSHTRPSNIPPYRETLWNWWNSQPKTMVELLKNPTKNHSGNSGVGRTSETFNQETWYNWWNYQIKRKS